MLARVRALVQRHSCRAHRRRSVRLYGPATNGARQTVAGHRHGDSGAGGHGATGGEAESPQAGGQSFSAATVPGCFGKPRKLFQGFFREMHVGLLHGAASAKAAPACRPMRGQEQGREGPGPVWDGPC